MTIKEQEETERKIKGMMESLEDLKERKFPERAGTILLYSEDIDTLMRALSVYQLNIMTTDVEDAETDRLINDITEKDADIDKIETGYAKIDPEPAGARTAMEAGASRVKELAEAITRYSSDAKFLKENQRALEDIERWASEIESQYYIMSASIEED